MKRIVASIKELFRDYQVVAANRVMTYLCLSNLITVAGSSATVLILPLLVLKTTGSPSQVALTILATVLGTLFGAQFLHPRLRKIHPSRLVTITELLSAAAIALILFASFLPFFSYSVLALSFFLMTAQGVWQTSVQYLIKQASTDSKNERLTEHFVAANDFSSHVGTIGGPLLVALLFLVADVRYALLFDCLSFLLSAYLLSRIHFKYDAPREHKPIYRAILDENYGFKFFALLIIPFFIQSALAVNISGMVIHIAQALNGTPSDIALIDAAGSVGLILGTFFAPTLASLRATVPIAIFAEGLGFLGMGLGKTSLHFGTFQFVYYVALGIAANGLRSSLQRMIPKERIADVMGLRLSILEIAKVISMGIVSAWLISGTTVPLYVGASCVLVTMALAAAWVLVPPAKTPATATFDPKRAD